MTAVNVSLPFELVVAAQQPVPLGATRPARHLAGPPEAQIGERAHLVVQAAGEGCGLIQVGHGVLGAVLRSAGESGVQVQHPVHLEGPAVVKVRAQRVGGRNRPPVLLGRCASPDGRPGRPASSSCWTATCPVLIRYTKELSASLVTEHRHLFKLAE